MSLRLIGHHSNIECNISNIVKAIYYCTVLLIVLSYIPMLQIKSHDLAQIHLQDNIYYQAQSILSLFPLTSLIVLSFSWMMLHH